MALNILNFVLKESTICIFVCMTSNWNKCYDYPFMSCCVSLCSYRWGDWVMAEWLTRLSFNP